MTADHCDKNNENSISIKPLISSRGEFFIAQQIQGLPQFATQLIAVSKI